MRPYILWAVCGVLLTACQQDPKKKETIKTPESTVVHTTQMVDDIQVNTIQIGGESNKDKNNFQASYPETKYDFINEIEKAQTLAFQKEFEDETKRATEDAVSGITFGRHFEILENSEHLLGFLHETYRSFGNTFSDEFQTNYYDLTERKQVQINDLFLSSKAFNTFATMVRKATSAELKKIVDADNTLDATDKVNMFKSLEPQIKEGTDAKPQNYSTVIFKSDSIQVIFNKYQVAPGNMGSITVKIAAQDLGNLFKEKYQVLFQLEKAPEVIPATEESKPVADNTDTKVPETILVDCGKVPCIALTFDDGPSVHTNRLLDILKSENVKATFFVLGKSAKIQPKTILRQHREGHVVANHSWNHKQLSKLTVGEVADQINNTNQAIENILDTKVAYLRPPYGAFNSDVKQVAKMPIILWSLDPLDWKDRNAETVAQRMLDVKADGIILAHDIHKSTVDAIPEVIKALKEKGFYFVTLDELYAGKTLVNGKVYNKR